MKAIMVGGLCLKCHGRALNAEVVHKLDGLYPKNQARGYQLGQLRGAWSVKEEL